MYIDILRTLTLCLLLQANPKLEHLHWANGIGHVKPCCIALYCFIFMQEFVRYCRKDTETLSRRITGFFLKRNLSCPLLDKYRYGAPRNLFFSSDGNKSLWKDIGTWILHPFFVSKLMIALSLIMCALVEHNCVLKSFDAISCKKGKPAVLSARDCAMVRHQCATR